MYFSVVLITGGDLGYKVTQSAELFLPSSNTTCSLPQLSKARRYHTQDGGLACGGDNLDGDGDSVTRSCDKWSAGTWTQTSHTLRKGRSVHVSWPTAEGVYLIGGVFSGSGTTSELVKEDGSVEEGFALKYSTL